MASVLAIAGLALRPADGSPSAPLEPDMETLAEAEHNGWMAHRAANGWAYGSPRDDAQKRHPSMVLYAGLPEKEPAYLRKRKDKDRDNIHHDPEFAARAGQRITSA